MLQACWVSGAFLFKENVEIMVDHASELCKASPNGLPKTHCLRTQSCNNAAKREIGQWSTNELMAIAVDLNITQNCIRLRITCYISIAGIA